MRLICWLTINFVALGPFHRNAPSKCNNVICVSYELKLLIYDYGRICLGQCVKCVLHLFNTSQTMPPCHQTGCNLLSNVYEPKGTTSLCYWLKFLRRVTEYVSTRNNIVGRHFIQYSNYRFNTVKTNNPWLNACWGRIILLMPRLPFIWLRKNVLFTCGGIALCCVELGWHRQQMIYT